MNEKRARGEGRIFVRGTTLWIQYQSSRHLQVRESTEIGIDEKNAEKRAAKILRTKLGEVAAGIVRDTRGLRYEDLRDAFIADYQANRRKSLRLDREGNPSLDKVNRLDGFFTGYRAAEIDAQDIRKFIAEQQARGLSNGTINRSISALRRMFHIARTDGKLRNLPSFPMLKESAPRSGFFEREQYDKLSAALPNYLQLPLALGFFTGMREGEILGLEWEQVDFLSGVIRLRPGETKSGEGREIPIVPQLRVLLEQQHGKRAAGCELVCFRIDRLGHAQPIGNFRKSWYRCCVACGLGKMEPTGELSKPRPDRKRAKPKPKMRYAGAIFHDLRRSGVRNLVRAGVPERVAMAISGHKTRSVFERYNIVSQSDVADAGRKLASFLGDNSGTMCTTMQQGSSATQ